MGCFTVRTNLHDQFEVSATKDIKLKLALEQVVKAENIEAKDEEINEKIDALAKAYGNDGDAIKNNPNARMYMAERIRQEKAIDAVVSNVVEK